MTMTYRYVKDMSGICYGLPVCQTVNALTAYMKTDPSDL